jgi:hypothetical protein
LFRQGVALAVAEANGKTGRDVPGDPLTDEDIVSKFRANTESILSYQRADEIIESTWALDSLNNISDYMSFFIL